MSVPHIGSLLIKARTIISNSFLINFSADSSETFSLSNDSDERSVFSPVVRINLSWLAASSLRRFGLTLVRGYVHKIEWSDDIELVLNILDLEI